MEQVFDNNKNISHLNCSICFEQLEEPLRISCNHTFCKKCLLAWMRPGNRTCPMCRRNMDFLVVDTMEDIIEEGFKDFAKRPAIADVILKRSITRRPVVFYHDQFDEMLMEDRLDLEQGKLPRTLVFLMKLRRYLVKMCGPSFKFGAFFSLVLMYFVFYWIVGYCTGASGMNNAENSGDQTGWFTDLQYIIISVCLGSLSFYC